MLSPTQIDSYWGEREKIAAAMTGISRALSIGRGRKKKTRTGKRKHANARAADDPDESQTDKAVDPEDSRKKHCIDCGATVDQDDRHCRKCGAKQVIKNEHPRFLGQRKKKDVDDSRDKRHLDETGAEAAETDSGLHMSKVGFKALKKMLPKKHRPKYNAAVGTTALVGGGYGAVELHQMLNPKPPEDPQLQKLSAACRSINPVHNIRKGKKRRRIVEALARTSK